MAILNRRNAVLGWVTAKVVKKVVKKKTADAATSPKTGGAVAGIAALGGALLFWRKQRADGSDE
jgi:hypothetical protein